MEYLTTLSGLYATSIGLETYMKYNELMNKNKYKNIKLEKYDKDMKGISLFTIDEKIDMPVYVNTGSHIGMSIPIGGGDKYSENKYLYSQFLFTHSTCNYEHFSCTDTNQAEFYINTYESLNNVLTQYNIDQNKLIIRLPLLAKRYSLSPTVYMIHNKNIGVLGTKKNEVIKEFVFKSRRTFALTSVFVTACGCIYQCNKKMVY